MDETTNNVTWTNSTATSTDGSFTLSFPSYCEPEWDPYTEIKYEPKWHIQKGYKCQLKHMWD